jgi:hypothetical protein
MIYKNALLDLDANGYQIHGPLPFSAKKSVTFDGGTTNDCGDYNGTGNPKNLFTVTGDVLMVILAVAETALVGASATLEVGVASATAELIAQTVAANIAIKKAWVDTGPSLAGEVLPSAHIVGRSQTIIQTVGTANITSGKLNYYCFWRPLSDDGNVVAA